MSAMRIGGSSSSDSCPECPSLTQIMLTCDPDSDDMPYLDLAANQLCYECINVSECDSEFEEEVTFNGEATVDVCFKKVAVVDP